MQSFTEFLKKTIFFKICFKHPVLFFIVFPESIVLHAIELDEADFQNSEIVYVSPTRLKQSPHDTPASVSRITRDTIKKLQINSLPEVFRYIAGMITARISGNTYFIDYHSTNALDSNRMQIFIDGISVYRPSYADSQWATLPITIQDIDYIEVTRSPSAATYGINSLMAVVNIVTKSPLESEGLSASISEGSEGYEQLNLSFSGNPSEQFSYRISAATNNENDYENEDIGGDDSLENNLINSTFNFTIDQSTKASLAFYYSESDYPGISFPRETESQYYSGKLNHVLSANHEFKVKTSYTRVRETDVPEITRFAVFFSEPLRELHLLNPDYAFLILNPNLITDDQPFPPLNATPEEDELRDRVFEEILSSNFGVFTTTITGDVNQNTLEENFSVEFQDTYIFNEELRFVSGFGISQDKLDSSIDTNGEVSSTTYRLFGNAEKSWRRWLVNIGGMLEHSPEIINNPVFSPRLGINYRLNEDSTIRFVLSKAIRIPDLLDSELDFDIYVENFSEPYPVPGDERTSGYIYNASKKSINLESEEILAREISLYTGKLFPYNDGYVKLNSDFKLFYNSLSKTPEFFEFDTSGLSPTQISLDQSAIDTIVKGFETDFNLSLSGLFDSNLDSMDFHVNYTYLDDSIASLYEDNEILSRRPLTPRHFGSIYSIFTFKNDWFTTLSYYGNSEIAGQSFAAYELGLGKSVKLSPGSLVFSGKFVYHPDRFIRSDERLFGGLTDLFLESIDDSTSFFLTLDLRL